MRDISDLKCCPILVISAALLSRAWFFCVAVLSQRDIVCVYKEQFLYDFLSFKTKAVGYFETSTVSEIATQFDRTKYVIYQKNSLFLLSDH